MGKVEQAGPALVAEVRVTLAPRQPEDDGDPTDVLKSQLVPDGDLQQEVDSGDGDAAARHPDHHQALPHRHHPLKADYQPQLDQTARCGQAHVAHENKAHVVVEDDQGCIGQRAD